jgi:hypothetical protein
MVRGIPLTKRSALLGLLVFGVLPGPAWAQTETVLYSFCAQYGHRCTDRPTPFAGVVLDQARNVYGTTAYGGAHNCDAKPPVSCLGIGQADSHRLFMLAGNRLSFLRNPQITEISRSIILCESAAVRNP